VDADAIQVVATLAKQRVAQADAGVAEAFSQLRYNQHQFNLQLQHLQ